MDNVFNIFPVTVKFSPGIPASAQGPSLLAFEKSLRDLTGLDCRVFKEKMGDDSKLRRAMTPEEREKL